MDLELSISLSDTIINNNMTAEYMTNSSSTQNSPRNGIRQVSFADLHVQGSESKRTFSIPLQPSIEEEENDRDVKSNVAPPDNVKKNVCGEQMSQTTCILKDQIAHQISTANSVNTHFSKDEGGFTPLIMPKLSSTENTPVHSINQSDSLRGPIITGIKIGTPVRRDPCTNQKASSDTPSEVEYTISITNHNTLKVQMTTSSSARNSVYDTNSCSCSCSPEKKSVDNGDRVEYVGEAQYPAPVIQVGDQIVKLRPKKNTNNNYITARSYLSKTDEMKRHSTEISQLRHSLEQKIAAYQSVVSKDNNNPSEKKRTSSTMGFSNLCDSPSKENFRQCDPLCHVRKSMSYTSSPLHWQKHVRNTVHVADPRKLRFLLEDHQRSCDQYASNLYNEYKNDIDSMDAIMSTPPTSKNNNFNLGRNDKTYNPYIRQRCSSSFSDYEDNSLYSTPIGSPGPSSLRYSRMKRNCVDATKLPEGPITEADGRINYYPNCDATIWLRSCHKEITEPLSGTKSGDVPLWLSGTLIRNGPGRLKVGDHQYNHLFDGSALLHRFHFHKGQVTYQNKFLKSRSYLRDTKAQRIVVNYFGTRAHPDPCRTILQNIASKFEFEEHFTDNAQISLYPYGDGLYALTETPFIFRVDPETLDTHEKVDLTKCVAVLSHTAHPHVDRDGTVYNIGQGVGPVGPRYHICKFPNPKTDKKGKTKSPFDQAQIVGSVNARWRLNPCYMHSFAMTENYFIIIEQPLVVSVPKILKVVLRQDALIDALQWWEKETKIHVVRRDNGSPVSTQYVTETFFFLHTINAYEDRGHIILDISTYKNAEMLHCMYVEALKNAAYDPTYAQMFRGRPKRWVIPLHPNKDASIGTNLVTLPDTKCQGRWLKKGVIYLTPELLSDIGCEVPRIHYDKYNGRPYRYFYAICSDIDHQSPGTLVKVDVVNKTHVEWSEDNVYPSEPIFVPHPQAKNEDEGVVLCALLRAKGLDNQVCLLILDAATFTERGRVEFVAPGPVPKCLHGWFVQEGTLRGVKNDSEKEEEEKKEDGGTEE